MKTIPDFFNSWNFKKISISRKNEWVKYAYVFELSTLFNWTEFEKKVGLISRKIKIQTGNVFIVSFVNLYGNQ